MILFSIIQENLKLKICRALNTPAVKSAEISHLNINGN